MENKSRYISETARIDENVSLGNDCIIEDNVTVESHVSLGDEVHISSNSIIYGPVEIGSGSYIGPACIIGHPTRKELKKLILKNEKIHSLKNPIQIGSDCLIRSGCLLYSDIKIDKKVEFGHNVIIREKVTIGSNTMIGTNCVLDGNIKIGNDVRIQTGVYISPYSKIKNRIFLGPNCMLLNDKYAMQKKVQLQGPIIENGVSIGANALIFPAISIGEGSVIGAGAVVTKNVPPKTIYVGMPAKRVNNVPDGWKI
jgi:acetyltransferase-like isoleucine patch superfamily enzyme